MYVKIETPAQETPSSTVVEGRRRRFAGLRRWITRTFDYRDAFTPTSAW